MNISILNRNELKTMDYVNDSFTTMKVLAVIPFMFFICSLIFGWIDNKNKLKELQRLSYIDGYVDFMVHTYFYGYLKKTIPDQGTPENRGLSGKIKRYKYEQRLTDEDFPFYKIFIIICASGFVPPTLDMIDEERIQPQDHLPPVEISRAGTNGRVYTTAVYKVKYRNLRDHITVAMEGTPPLLTMLDASAEDPVLKSYKKQIIEMFYKRLSKKLDENMEFANSYEIVFYNDDPDKPTLADEIILRHIDKGLVRPGALEYPPSDCTINRSIMHCLGTT